jgi:hypothetical protein
MYLDNNQNKNQSKNHESMQQNKVQKFHAFRKNREEEGKKINKYKKKNENKNKIGEVERDERRHREGF